MAVDDVTYDLPRGAPLLSDITIVEAVHHPVMRVGDQLPIDSIGSSVLIIFEKKRKLVASLRGIMS